MSDYFTKKPEVEVVHLKRVNLSKRIAENICEGLDLIWCVIRLHYVVLIALGINIYFFYRFILSNDWVFFIAGAIILFFGIALDNRTQAGWGMY